MSRRGAFTISLLIIAMLAGSGCTLGPAAHRPDSVADEAEQFVAADDDQKQIEPHTIQWWQRFDDQTTNRLVTQALQRNTDLQLAAARMLEARAALGVAFGQRLPSIDAGFSRDRSQRTFEFQAGRFQTLNTTYDLRATVNWQVDLFGRLRRQQEAAWYRLLASDANRRAVLHTVVAEVVRTRASIATLQRRLEIARETVDSFQRTTELVQRRYDRGVANALELRTAEENLADARSRVPELRFQLKTAHHALDVLVSRQPGTGDAIDEQLATLPQIDPPPVGIPATLLDRRPDLRQTELRAKAEQAEIGVAIADLFPDLTISAAGGYQASEANDLIDPQSQIWSLVSEIAMKIFRGGALRANIDQARAQAQAAAAEYAGAVLAAFKEVEDALIREQTARQRYAQLQQQVSKAEQAEELAQQRYQRGVENLLNVLEVQRRRFNAQDTLVQTQQTIWSARVDLFLALGGDWVSRKTKPGEDASESADQQMGAADPPSQPQSTASAENPASTSNTN